MTSTDIWSEIYINDITDSEMDSFKNLVISDVKGQSSQEDKTILLNNLSLWNYNLQILRKDIELQLSCQKAKLKMYIQTSEQNSLDSSNYIEEQTKWRMSALKFLSNIEKRSLYVKLLINQIPVE